MSEMESCSSCRFFRPGARSVLKEGICRFEPPQQLTEEKPHTESHTQEDEDGFTTLTIEAIEMYIGWPDVNEHDWCGKWEPIRTPPG